MTEHNIELREHLRKMTLAAARSRIAEIWLEASMAAETRSADVAARHLFDVCDGNPETALAYVWDAIEALYERD